MNILEKEQLIKINGGGISLGVGAIIFSVAVFIIGLVDGYVRPLACRK